MLVGDHARESVVYQAGQPRRRRWFLHMRARRGQRDHLRIHAGFAQHLFAVVNVAMPGTATL